MLDPVEELCAAESRWWMFCFKVQPCLEPMPHDWATCPQQHHTEKAARRCPKMFRYAAVRCPQHNKKLAGGGRASCSKGDTCGCAHSVYELWLHPDRFRTQMCLHGQACTKPLCFFAHSAAELRSPQQLHGSRPDGPERDERDATELLVELHAAYGGGRFSLAAALAEVQLRQRRLYGPQHAAGRAGAAVGPASGSAPSAAAAAAAMAAFGSGQHALQQQPPLLPLQGLQAHAAHYGQLPSDAAMAAAVVAAAQQGAAAFAAAQGLGLTDQQRPSTALQLLGQQLTQAAQKRRLSGNEHFLRQMTGSAHAQLGCWPPAQLSDVGGGWAWDSASASPAGSSPPGSAGAPLAPALLLSQMGLQAPDATRSSLGPLPNGSPLGSILASAGAAAAAAHGGARADSMMWPLDLEPPAVAAGQLDGLVARTGSGVSTLSSSSPGSLLGVVGQPSSALASSNGAAGTTTGSSSSDSSPIERLHHDAAVSTPPAASAAAAAAFPAPELRGGCAASTGSSGTPPVAASPRRQLQQQIELLQREQEQQALKLRMLELQCQSGGLAAPGQAAGTAAARTAGPLQPFVGVHGL